MRSPVVTDRAPSAIGPYAQANVVGDFVFTAGQIALRPDGTWAGGDIATETAQVLDNLEAVLAAAGCALTDVVKTTVFLADLTEFSAMNAVYGSRFATPYPARSTVQAAALPRGARVEIEAIAHRGSR